MLKNMRLRVPAVGKVGTISLTVIMNPDAQCAKKLDINLDVTNASTTFPKNPKIWKLSKEKKTLYPISFHVNCRFLERPLSQPSKLFKQQKR